MPWATRTRRRSTPTGTSNTRSVPPARARCGRVDRPGVAVELVALRVVCADAPGGAGLVGGTGEGSGSVALVGEADRDQAHVVGVGVPRSERCGGAAADPGDREAPARRLVPLLVHLVRAVPGRRGPRPCALGRGPAAAPEQEAGQCGGAEPGG